jgi:hypothetical protein
LLDVNNFDRIKISLASPEQIRSWSSGEVKKPETIYGIRQDISFRNWSFPRHEVPPSYFFLGRLVPYFDLP